MTFPWSVDKILWVLSSLCFLMGITLPMFTMEKFFLFKDAFSLLGGLYQLLENRELFLFLLIFTFSLAFPLCKFFLSFSYVFNRPSAQELRLRKIRKISAVGKWSMADVFVISVLASTIKVGGFAHVRIEIGLLFFAVSVLLSLILSSRLMSQYELKPKYNIEDNSL